MQMIPLGLSRNDCDNELLVFCCAELAFAMGRVRTLVRVLLLGLLYSDHPKP